MEQSPPGWYQCAVVDGPKEGLITIHYADGSGIEDVNLHAVKVRFQHKVGPEFTRFQVAIERQVVKYMHNTHTETHTQTHTHTQGKVGPEFTRFQRASSILYHLSLHTYVTTSLSVLYFGTSLSILYYFTACLS